MPVSRRKKPLERWVASGVEEVGRRVDLGGGLVGEGNGRGMVGREGRRGWKGKGNGGHTLKRRRRGRRFRLRLEGV